MLTIKEINSAIMFGSLTNEELSTVVQAVQFARAQLAKNNKNMILRGSKVRFTSTRTGQLVTGEVTDVKRKFVHIRAGMQNWRVPMSMVTPL